MRSRRPPVRPPTNMPARPKKAPSNRARSSVAPPVVVARAPPSGRRPRSYTHRARVAVRMCVSERARTQCNVGVDVRRARRGSLMRLSLLRLRRLYIYIYKRINTPYAPDLNPPLSAIATAAVRIRFSHRVPSRRRHRAFLDHSISLASHHRRTPFSPETTFQPLGIVYILCTIIYYYIYRSLSASQPHVIKDIG